MIGKLVKEPATGHFDGRADNVLLLGPPGAGKTHLAIALGRAVVEAGDAVLLVTTTALLGAAGQGDSKGRLAE